MDRCASSASTTPIVGMAFLFPARTRKALFPKIILSLIFGCVLYCYVSFVSNKGSPLPYSLPLLDEYGVSGGEHLY